MRNLVELADLGTRPRMFDLYVGITRIGYLVDNSKNCANDDDLARKNWIGYVNGHGHVYAGSLCRALAQVESLVQEGDKE